MEMPEFSQDKIYLPIDEAELCDLADSIGTIAQELGKERELHDGWTATFQLDSHNEVTCRFIIESTENSRRPPGIYLTHTSLLEDTGDEEIERVTDYSLPFDDDPSVCWEIDIWENESKSEPKRPDTLDDHGFELEEDDRKKWLGVLNNQYIAPLDKADYANVKSLIGELNIANAVKPTDKTVD